MFFESSLNGYKVKVVSAVLEAGSCYFKISASNLTSRKAAVVRGLPLVHSKGVTKTPRLLVENENAGFSRKTDFFQLPILADEHRIIR